MFKPGTLVIVNKDALDLIGVDVYDAVNYFGVAENVIHTTFKACVGIVIDTYPSDEMSRNVDMYEVIMLDDGRIVRGWVFDYDISATRRR